MVYDLIIIGGGPGGYRAAELAGFKGLSTLLIEKDLLGGTCLNRGCIPTKSYYADVIDGAGPVEAMWDKKEAVVDKLRRGIEQLMKLRGVTLCKGTAGLSDLEGPEKTVSIEGSPEMTQARGRRILIATGGTVFPLAFEGNDLPQVIPGHWAVAEPSLWKDPKVQKVALLGAGVIAVEMATILQGLGKEVVLLKHSNQVLRRCDGDIKKKIKQALKKQKVRMVDFFEPLRAQASSSGEVTLWGKTPQGEEKISCDRIILASSMVPSLEGFGLENTSLKYSSRGIQVNPETMETSLEGVYAIGDCTGGMMLAHTAEYQALSAVAHMSGDSYSFKPRTVPYCIFSHPEIAAVGYTEEEALEKGWDVVTSKAYFAANGMALAKSSSDGFCKVVAERPGGKILGVHIMGPQASSLVSEAALGVYHGMTAQDMAYCVHPHPTLSECLKDAFFRVVEILEKE